MNDPNPRDRIIADIISIYDLARQHPALRLPRTGPARVAFHYNDIPYAETARASVANARRILSGALGVRFTELPEIAGDGTPRYLLGAQLPSGLTVVIVSRFQAGGDLDERADAGELVAA